MLKMIIQFDQSIMVSVARVESEQSRYSVLERARPVVSCVYAGTLFVYTRVCVHVCGWVCMCVYVRV